MTEASVIKIFVICGNIFDGEYSSWVISTIIQNSRYRLAERIGDSDLIILISAGGTSLEQISKRYRERTVILNTSIVDSRSGEEARSLGFLGYFGISRKEEALFEVIEGALDKLREP